MQIFCGTDIIEIERIKREIDQHGKKFINRIYTEDEINYCESKRLAKYQHYAARFAGKEAIFKAVSKRLDNKYDITWTSVEIVNDKNGRPKVNILDEKLEKIKEIDISLSHCKEYAVAMVVAEVE